MSSTSPIDLQTSVAGEEDPGASTEIGSATENARTMAPGDQAPPGTPSTGENVCPDCGGSGTKAGGTCPTCLGKGTVIVGIGGA